MSRPTCPARLRTAGVTGGQAERARPPAHAPPWLWPWERVCAPSWRRARLLLVRYCALNGGGRGSNAPYSVGVLGWTGNGCAIGGGFFRPGHPSMSRFPVEWQIDEPARAL
eukprot:366318-Chlamydomonas_euryale.AAC.11